MARNLIFLTLFLVGCATTNKHSDWVDVSDSAAERFTRELSAIYPELGSSLGYDEFDGKGVIYSVDIDQKELKVLKGWKLFLTSELEKNHLKELQVDYLILKDAVEHGIKSLELSRSLKVAPFNKGTEDIYNNLFMLVNQQSPPKRKKAAVSRFNQYVSPSNGSPLLLAYIDSFDERIKENGGVKQSFFPYIEKVKKYLANTESYKKGIKELLQKSGEKGWEENYSKFIKQAEQYDQFVRSKILPFSRKNPQMKQEAYIHRLKGIGVDISPNDLIKIGKAEYKKLYKEYEKLAFEISKKYSLKKESPKAVIDFLKKNQVTTPAEVKRLYENADNKLENIIKSNQLVSLPQTPLKIRIAGDAESKASPVPHLKPPPLVNNNGILPEFVVPTSTDGKVPFDDFSYATAATVFTAHEGRPGHDLQFSRMLENRISIIRARYAMNSVNVEGWGLYAEDLVYPYISLEEKFVALQTRLWRVARYWLDPSVQLNKAAKKDVIRVFNKELGVSPVMSNLEFQRYAFRDPGQATSYFHGLLKIRDLKKALEKSFGTLNMMCFNDTLLSFGLMPHEYIKMFKEKFKECSI